MQKALGKNDRVIIQSGLAFFKSINGHYPQIPSIRQCAVRPTYFFTNSKEMSKGSYSEFVTKENVKLVFPQWLLMTFLGHCVQDYCIISAPHLPISFVLLCSCEMSRWQLIF